MVIYRGPAHDKRSVNVKQKHSIFIAVVFHYISVYDCHLFFKELIVKKKDKVELVTDSMTNEKCISVTNGCIRLKALYRFISVSVGFLVETIVGNNHKTIADFKTSVGEDNILNIVEKIESQISRDGYNNKTFEDVGKDFPDEIEKFGETSNNYMSENDPKILKTEFLDQWNILTQKLAYPYEYFNSFGDFQEPVNNSKQNLFSKLKSGCLDDKRKARTVNVTKIKILETEKI